MKRVVEACYLRGRTVVVTYDLDAFLSAAAEAVPSIFLNERPSALDVRKDATANMLAETIVEWDLHRNGRACPTDREFLSNLSTRILFLVAWAIADDAMEAVGEPPTH